MASCPVRFEFVCNGNQKLKFIHNLPKTLVDNAMNRTPQSTQSFVTTIQPIVGQHYRAAYNASMDICCICESPKSQVLMSPVSWLHVPNDPFVYVMVSPACDNPQCDTSVRQKVQELIGNMSGTPGPANLGYATPASTEEVMACRVCKTVENTSKCGRCKTAFYCGKEHQRMDWKFHKAACKAAS